MRSLISYALTAAAACLILYGQSDKSTAKPGLYWPGQHWRTASPESQGVDSDLLSKAVDEVVQKHLGVHSLMVIRHGYVVLDNYFYPYNADTPHDLASVTKTITSVLSGIAIGQGIVKTDQRVLSFFPKEAPANPDERKQRITVGNLIAMDSGLDCGYTPGEQELEQMKRSANWVQFALGLPMKNDPGIQTSYCSPGYHVLGSLIGAATHQTELEFGRKNLFAPLQMRDVVWADDPQGRNHGWGDSHFFPEDLAKIGYLYLHGGEWNGKQLVPKDWVALSIAPSAGGRGTPGNLGYEWNATKGANGLQYGGTGRGGQSLLVWPELDTIVVITAGGNGGQIANMVRQAVKPEPLPANADAVKQLQTKVADAAKAPAAGPASPLPAMAASISGKLYQFPLNTSRLDDLSLTFKDANEARVKVKYLGEDYTFPVGLDGRYRLGPNGPLHLLAGAMGRWTSDTEFALDLNFIANINHYTLNIKFDGDKMEVAANEASGIIRNGHIIGTRKP